MKIKKCIKQKNKTVNKGFTLIELLVGVLIIGILAGIALPQYRRAKEKAEASELQIIVKSVYEAQQRYYLVHGEYAKKFDNLDVELNGYTRGGCEHLSAFGSKTDCFSNGKNTIHIGPTANTALRKTGKYEKAGFILRNVPSEYLPENKLLCYEYKGKGFCEELFNCNLFYRQNDVNSYFSCPN